MRGAPSVDGRRWERPLLLLLLLSMAFTQQFAENLHSSIRATGPFTYRLSGVLCVWAAMRASLGKTTSVFFV